MPEHGPEAGAGGDAQDVGRHQRIAKQRLVGGPGGGDCRTDKDGGEHARQAHLEQHGIDLSLCRRIGQPAADGRQHLGTM